MNGTKRKIRLPKVVKLPAWSDPNKATKEDNRAAYNKHKRGATRRAR